MLYPNSTIYPFTVDDLQTLCDYDGGSNVVYLGRAQPGTSSTATTGWQIRKYTYDGSSNVTVVQFASGTNDYDKAWSSRASYTYSLTA